MMHPPALSRRGFLATSSACIAGVALSHPRQTSAQESSGWIDAHVHVWTPDTRKYPLAPGFSHEDMRPPSFTPEELFVHTKPAGVNRIVLIQMSFYNFDNSYMLDMMDRYPGVFSGIAIVDHSRPDVGEQMQHLAKRGVRGFRIHARPGDAERWIRSEGMARLWEVAADEGLAVCPLINPSDLPHVDRLCSRFSDTTVVVDHFARVGISGSVESDQIQALCRLARFPQVHVKTSAFYALGRKRPPYRDLLPMLERVLDAFGPDRLMWASDCPYQVQGIHSYEASLALIRDADGSLLSAAEKQWLLRGTAEKLFF